MTALEHSATTMPAHVRPALGLRGVNPVSRLIRAWKNRREIYQLGEMNDAQLADIGLTRGDLHVVWNAPLGVDPTERLGTISASRMRALEAASRRVT